MRILDTKFMRGFIKMADDGFQQEIGRAHF